MRLTGGQKHIAYVLSLMILAIMLTGCDSILYTKTEQVKATVVNKITNERYTSTSDNHWVIVVQHDDVYSEIYGKNLYNTLDVNDEVSVKKVSVFNDEACTSITSIYLSPIN